MKIRSIAHSIAALILCVAPAALAQEIAIPPDADGAAAALKDSPRHGEYVNLDLEGSDVKLKTFVAYPERSDKAPVVILIHEIFGMTDWTNAAADALAKEGFIVVAPDLISGVEGAAENPREAISKLTPEETLKRLNAALKYGKSLPSATGKIGCVGFCYGGRTTFAYATEQPELNAAVVYYGNAPETASLAKITCPPRQQHAPASAGRDEETGQSARCKHLRRCGPWFSAPAGRPGWRQPESEPAGLGEDGGFLQGAPGGEVGGRVAILDLVNTLEHVSAQRGNSIGNASKRRTYSLFEMAGSMVFLLGDCYNGSRGNQEIMVPLSRVA